MPRLHHTEKAMADYDPGDRKKNPCANCQRVVRGKPCDKDEAARCLLATMAGFWNGKEYQRRVSPQTTGERK